MVNNTVENVRYNANNPNASVIYKQNGVWNNDQYQFTTAQTMDNNSSGLSIGQPPNRSTLRRGTDGNYKETPFHGTNNNPEDPFYSVIMHPILSDLDG